MNIPVTRTRVRKPTPERTCCPTHAENCTFGRDHVWSIGWIAGPNSGLGIGEPGWHDSMVCSTCHGICTTDMEPGQVA